MYFRLQSLSSLFFLRDVATFSPSYYRASHILVYATCVYEYEYVCNTMLYCVCATAIHPPFPSHQLIVAIKERGEDAFFPDAEYLLAQHRYNTKRRDNNK